MRTWLFGAVLSLGLSGCGGAEDQATSSDSGSVDGDGGVAPDARPPLARDGLPLGTLCDDSEALVYDQQLLEPVKCGEDGLPIPAARLESPPRTPSPYAALRCVGAVADQELEALFDCGETEFWHAFSDGRLQPREEALAYMSEAIDRLSAVEQPSADFEGSLARLHQLRGMFYMGIGQENGRLDYLVGADRLAGEDFRAVEALEPDNFVATVFDSTLEMTFARMANEHARAAELARGGLEYALNLGDPDVVEDVNVGAVFAITGITMTWPLSSGVPQASLEAKRKVGCLPEVEFCTGNTLHAPYARPGLEYHEAEMYARLGMRDAYIEQLEKVAAQPGYEDWAWYDVVELQRREPGRLLGKFAAYGEDRYVDSYATMNNGCVMCHGRI